MTTIDKQKTDQRRLATSVNAYLILRKEDQVLLLLRENTGYLDGHWSLPAGHVEIGEPATAGMIREAKEEVGITVSPEDLNVVHITHCKTGRMNIDIFFECHKWTGKIENKEPEKCGGVGFFPLDALPSPIIEYNATILNPLNRKGFYSEWGFGDTT